MFYASLQTLGLLFTWEECPTEEFWEHLFFLPLLHRAFSPMSQSPQVLYPYLPRCCSQSLRANFVPELTLSFPSAVVGVVRSSVDTGKARGRAPPSSFSSTILHNDGSCLGCAPVSGLALFYGTLPATGGKGWVGVPLIYGKEQVQGGLNDLPLWGSGTQTQVVSASQLKQEPLELDGQCLWYHVPPSSSADQPNP